MNRSTFIIKKMDCPSEEHIIRLKLDSIPEITFLDFDIPNRKLTVTHNGNLSTIQQSIDSLNFNSSLLATEEDRDFISPLEPKGEQASLLWKVLSINFGFFMLEMITGLISRSMGLVADSLDMLADALVYGLSLLAVGGSMSKKMKIAGISGYFQMTLAIVGLVEVVRRFLGYEEVPDFRVMIGISVLALIANALCLYLLQRSKSQEAHMKASMIFTSNDIVINLGVIIAGVLVFLFNSKYPDLIIGSIVFIIVTKGALSILKLSK